MPDPIPFARPVRPPPPRPAPENDAERRERQLAIMRRLADLNMEAAEIAAAQIAQTYDAGQPHNSGPARDLSRATRDINQIFANENRIARGDPEPAQSSRTREQPTPRKPNRRRDLLQEALHPLAKSETSQAARTAARRRMDDAIDDALDDDPDEEIPIEEILFDIAKNLDLTIDPAKLTDEFLGIEPTHIIPDWPGPPGPAPPES